MAPSFGPIGGGLSLFDSAPLSTAARPSHGALPSVPAWPAGPAFESLPAISGPAVQPTQPFLMPANPQLAGPVPWGAEPAPSRGGLPPESLPSPPAEEPCAPLEPIPAECECQPKLWCGSVELGLAGSDGNSEAFAMRLGSRAKRTRPGDTLSLELNYSRGSNGGLESEHKLLSEIRHEWINPGSRFSRFIHGTLEYDEFRAFDLRLSADAGVGYALIKRDKTSLVTRLGGGFSREINGPDDDLVPEGLGGVDFEHQISPRQKITASVEYFPDVTALDDFRLNSKAAWEIQVDPDWELSLKLSAADRYDSTPNGAKANDVDYSALLMWAF